MIESPKRLPEAKERPCATCGTVYTSRLLSSRFCTPRCREWYWSLLQTMTRSVDELIRDLDLRRNKSGPADTR